METLYFIWMAANSRLPRSNHGLFQTHFIWQLYTSYSTRYPTDHQYLCINKFKQWTISHMWAEKVLLCVSLLLQFSLHYVWPPRIRTTKYHHLYATFSNDGTTKVWDGSKVEGKTLVTKSKLTYYQGNNNHCTWTLELVTVTLHRWWPCQDWYFLWEWYFTGLCLWWWTNCINQVRDCPCCL